MVYIIKKLLQHLALRVLSVFDLFPGVFRWKRIDGWEIWSA